MPIDYAKELGAMKPMKGGMRDKMASEPDTDDAYSSAKQREAENIATALGIDPAGIDGEALCDAIKRLVKLEE